jgi:hypothetical protein
VGIGPLGLKHHRGYSKHCPSGGLTSVVYRDEERGRKEDCQDIASMHTSMMKNIAGSGSSKKVYKCFKV